MPRAEIRTEALPVACFAPPLTDELLSRYEVLTEALPDGRGELRDALRECLRAVKLWWGLPESKRKDVSRFTLRHRGKDGTFEVRPLEDAHVKALWDAVPWPYELDSMQALFDRVFEGPDAPGKELRDCAYHLLWHARELCLDREPLTQDALPK